MSTAHGKSAPARRKPSRETRDRLVAVALELFGRQGFEAVGTRAIANAAGVNLAAIKYHFGSKEGLYNAVAAHIAAEIEGAAGPLFAAARSHAEAGSLTAEEARQILRNVLTGFLHILVANSETESWARFIVREQMAPSPAFDIIYGGVMGPAHEVMTRLVAALIGERPDSEKAGLTAFTLIGQTLVFRFARAAVTRRMDWNDIGPDEEMKIAQVLGSAVDRLAGAPQPEDRQ